jgi:hypothetical protein
MAHRDEGKRRTHRNEGDERYSRERNTKGPSAKHR